MLVQRAAEYALLFSLRAPAREGAYDTGTQCPDMVIACNVGQPTRNVLKCLAEERRLVRVLNEPTLTAGSILRRGSLRAVIYDRLTRSLGKEPETATPRDIYDALSLGVHEELSAR